MICDSDLPMASRLLDGGAAAEMLAPAIAAAGGTLRSLAPSQINYRAGRRMVVRYRAEVDRAGERQVETAVLMADARRLPRSAAVLGDAAGQRVAAWTYPHDPYLPGLPSATAPSAVRGLLRELGAAEGAVAITPRVYRPTSRAVLSIASSRQLYLKVVRPPAAEGLYRRHAELGSLLPVPAAYGVAAEQGVVVLETLPGESLGAALSGGRPVPPPGALLALLDRLAGVAAGPARPASPAETAATHAAAIAAVAPEEAGRARAIAAEAADPEWVADRCVHGDFYESQVLVAGGRISALLDIDELRRGDGLDDPATLLAHLEVLSWLRPHAARRIQFYRAAVSAASRHRGDPDALARRVAVALLGLCLWPFRAQLPDWRAATSALLDLAAAALPRRAHEELLIPASRPLHNVG